MKKFVCAVALLCCALAVTGCPKPHEELPNLPAKDYEAALPPGDFVLDPFSGSGTTLVAAELLGRNSLGIDAAADAVQLATQRLEQPFKTSSELLRKGRFDEIFFIDLPTPQERAMAAKSGL